MSRRIGTNVVPISHGRSVVRHAPPRRRLSPVTTRRLRSACLHKSTPAQRRVTPAWVCVASLIGVTMWPSAAVLLAKLALRMFWG